MKVVVTGASGFVGRALCRALAARGHEVVGLTRNLERVRDEERASVEWTRGSIGDPRSVAAAARGADVLFHAAGVTSLRASPRVLRWVHVAGTENVLRAARHAAVERVVHVSCADVSLCAEERMHWDEARVLAQEPVSAFARSKLMAEEIALAKSDDTLEVTALRPALLWGPGDFDGLARLAAEARDGGVRVYGGGRNIVALTHIDNLVSAALSAAESVEAPSRAYYVTDGEFMDARELFPKLLAACGLPTALRDSSLTTALLKARAAHKLGARAGVTEAEILRRGKSALFDLSRARKDLDYTPSVELGDALVELSAWVRAQGGIDAVVARARPEPSDDDIAEQVALAGGD